MKIGFVFLSVVFILGSPVSSMAASATDVAIPCLGADGSVKNAKEQDVCKALLTKCTDLKASLVSNLKEMLEWKIYGYYFLNKDIKLDKISGMIAGGEIVGDPIPYPVCSVVGHKVSDNDPGEIVKQSIPNGVSCGEDPIFQNGDAWNYRTKISYEGNKGARWFSYVMGAYPWEIRRNAADVIAELKDDLSNLHEVIHTDSMRTDVKNTLINIQKSTLKLAEDAKSQCNQPHETSIVEACKSGTLAVTDPVNKLCTLANVHLSLDKTAMPNMLVYEVMDRTQKMHDSYFGNIYNADANASFKQLLKHCAQNKSIADKVGAVLSPIGSTLKNAIQARKAYSCLRSCMTDGEEAYTWDDWSSSKNTGGGKQRKCAKKSKFDLDTGKPQSSISSYFESEGWVSWSWNPGGWWDGHDESTAESMLMEALNLQHPTNNVGFAGMIESIIRRDICKQGNNKSASNVCDSVGIKDKPAGK